MNWLHRLWARWQDWRREIEEPFDIDFPGYENTEPPIPDGMDCPDTQPTTPGALDTLPGSLE